MATRYVLYHESGKLMSERLFKTADAAHDTREGSLDDVIALPIEIPDLEDETQPGPHRMSDHPVNAELIRKYGGEVMTLVDLPLEAQLALIHYMSVDGAAWAVEDGWPEWRWGEGTPNDPEPRREMLADLEKFRPKFLWEYGGTSFGLVYVPTQALLEAMQNDQDFEAGIYELAETPKPDPTWEYEWPTWPVILSNFHFETIQDGWTRLSRYCDMAIETIPCVWYPD